MSRGQTRGIGALQHHAADSRRAGRRCKSSGTVDVIAVIQSERLVLRVHDQHMIQGHVPPAGRRRFTLRPGFSWRLYRRGHTRSHPEHGS